MVERERRGFLADNRGGNSASGTLRGEPRPEQLVKSTERVRDLGEVFTPDATVRQMLDLLPGDVWNSEPTANFLEPSCGNGNFLVAILDRKLERLSRNPSVKADSGLRAIKGLEALSSIYGIDLSPENIFGSEVGDEIGARKRLQASFSSWLGSGVHASDKWFDALAECAEWIISHNIVLGNMLASWPDGSPSGRNEIPVIEYVWDCAAGEVSVARTTMGDVMLNSHEEVQDMLWGAPDPQSHWSGPFLDLPSAPRIDNPFEETFDRSEVL